MKEISTDSLWKSSASETFSSSPLHDHVEADLVVLGGGYTGLSAALAAAERGMKVVVVEAHEIGFGGSGRNVGLVNAGLWLPPEDINEAIGQTVGQRLTNILGGGPDLVYGLIDKYKIACEPVRAGTLHCAHTQAGFLDLQKRCDQMQAIGADVSLLTAKETEARVGTKRLHGALFDPRAGTIQPLGYARGLARAATEAGAQIYENTPALSLGWENERWEIATPSGYVRAPAMLLATNAYPFRMSWVHPLKSIPVTYFQVSTAPLTDAQRAEILPGGEGCWDSATVMSSWRLDQEGRLIIGGMGQLDHVAGGVHRAWVRRKINRFFPALKGIPFEHFWDGRIAMTNDKLPKIWRFGPKAYACFGYSGRGIAPGTVFGQRLAASLLDGSEEVLPIVPVNENAIRAAGLRGKLIEAGVTANHMVRDWF